MILIIREHALFADMRKRQRMVTDLHSVHPVRAVMAVGLITVILSTVDSVHADTMIMQSTDMAHGLRSTEPSIGVLVPPVDTPKRQITRLEDGPR